MRFISTNIHGLFDYIIGALLIALPWLAGYVPIGGPESWIPIIIGAGIIGYSLLTDYEWGVLKQIPVRAHLMLDVIAGAAILMSLLYFGYFDQTIWPFHILASLVLIVSGLFTQRKAVTSRPRFRRPHVEGPPGRRV